MQLINIHWMKKDSLNTLFDMGALFMYEQGMPSKITTRKWLRDSIKFENVWVDFDVVNKKGN